MIFASLHGHSSFSSGDGHGSPEEHVIRAKDLGMTSIALTEHGTVSSHVQLEQAADKHGIKPIYGCEFYVAPPQTKQKFHQTVLAMNEDGYRQLSRLVTRSYDEGYYYYPTVHEDWLFDSDLTSDLIVLSGCADSMLSCTVAGGKSLGHRWTASELQGSPWNGEIYDYQRSLDNARSLTERYIESFGDRFYLEVQRFKNYYRTRHINSIMEILSVEFNIPLVGTADVHYPHPDEWEVQKLSNSIAWNIPFSEMDRDYSADPCTFPLSDKEMAQDLIDAGLTKKKAVEAVKMTKVIADRCDVRLPKTPDIEYSESNGKPNRILIDRIKEGIAYRQETSPKFAEDYGNRKKEYHERIKHELRTILPKHFSDYFLINQQIIGWAKDNGIVVGPGRGSAASSLVCYLMRLTEINPMEYPQMVFERFLDPGRTDDPDIDTDYQDDRRNEVFEYARSIYGDDHVGNIGNFSRFRGKTAMKSAAKSFNIPPFEVEKFTDLIVDPPFGDPREFNSAEDTEAAFPEAKEFMDKHPELRLAYELEGDQRTLGIHAAGMVISNRPISDTCAIYKRKKTNGDETEVIAYDKRDAAYLNMLKLDCLGLSTMTIVSDTLSMIDGFTLEDLYALPFDDEEVLRKFAQDDLTGIFQFEGRATRTVVKDIFSDRDAIPTFMTLADINALSRPGSLISGMTAQYIKVERGDKMVSIHPVVDDILKETNGCLVYQEQVMKIGTEFGGFTGAETSALRKIIGAKKAGGAFEEFWIKFRDGAKELHGVPESTSRKVWNYMAASASYLFNVAHAISYAAIAYWTMYLKTHYPCEFFAASLRNASKKGKVKGKADPQLLILQDAVAHNLTVSPPHPAISGKTWIANPERTGVIAGFVQIPGIGEKLANRILESGEKTWDGMVRNVQGFGPSAKAKAEKLAESEDPFGINLTNDAIYTVVKQIEGGAASFLQIPTATSRTIPTQDGDDVVYIGKVVAVKIIDVIGEMRSRQNLTTEEVLDKLEDPDLSTKAKIICADSGGTEVHVNISRYRYPDLMQEISEINSQEIWTVHVSGKASNAFGPAVQAYELTAIQLEE